jgi:hypothetical protein
MGVRSPEPRLATIEGQQTLIVPRTPPLQQKLDQLLSAMFHVTYRANVQPRGARSACTVARQHPFQAIREGRHWGLDGTLRDLRVEMCPFCGAVCVRDVSPDTLPGARPARGGPRRRNLILGWYSGKRPRGREYGPG